jgi:hypothetical protein
MSITPHKFKITRLPGAPVNDNEQVIMTGHFGKDALQLCDKWQLTEREASLWGMSPGRFSAAALDGMGEEARTSPLRSADAIMTASALGLLNALSSIVQSLPDQEARLILDEMSRQTDETVQKLISRGGR